MNWFKKSTKTVKGKTVAATASVACLKGKRPYTTTFTAPANSQARRSERQEGVKDGLSSLQQVI